MEREHAIREAARAIRPYLPDRAGGDSARLDAELAALLDAGADADRLLAVLRAHPRTRQWWLDFVRLGNVPPEIAPAGPVRAELPGLGLPVLPPRYACPRDDYVWYRRSPAMTVPSCPTHGIELRASPGKP